MPKEVFYVEIEEPIQLRRILLESSKDTIRLLKHNEEFKKLRIEKIKHISIIKNLIEEIKDLFVILKNELPATTLIEEEKVRKEKKHLIKKTKKIEKQEIKKLEEELSEIEKKLQSLE